MTEEFSDVSAPEDAVSRHLTLHLQTLQSDIERLTLQSFRWSLIRTTVEYDAIQHANVKMFLREACREKKMFSWALRVHTNVRVIGTYIMQTMTPLQMNLYLVCAYPVCSGGRRLVLEEEVFWDVNVDEYKLPAALLEMCEESAHFIDRQADPADEMYYKGLRF